MPSIFGEAAGPLPQPVRAPTQLPGVQSPAQENEAAQPQLHPSAMHLIRLLARHMRGGGLAFTRGAREHLDALSQLSGNYHALRDLFGAWEQAHNAATWAPENQAAQAERWDATSGVLKYLFENGWTQGS